MEAKGQQLQQHVAPTRSTCPPASAPSPPPVTAPDASTGPGPQGPQFKLHWSEAVPAGSGGPCVGEHPSELRFRGIGLRTRGKQSKWLLRDVGGACRGGTITALVGASGAGKSLLLDVLAGQAPGSCTASGSVTLDGRPLASAEMRQRACLVLQHDVLLETATVREAVTTSAMLRLPAKMPRAAKLARVEAVLKQLDLSSCADALVGDPDGGGQRLSGGQRRRTTLALELVRLPSLLLLDEPLSGLDSEMAMSVVAGLSRLAEQGYTVVLSVHQASPQMERSFDSLLMLAGGELVCAGPYAHVAACIQEAQLDLPSAQESAPLSQLLMEAVKQEATLARLRSAHAALSQQHGSASGAGGAGVPALTRKASLASSLSAALQKGSSGSLGACGGDEEQQLPDSEAGGGGGQAAGCARLLAACRRRWDGLSTGWAQFEMQVRTLAVRHARSLLRARTAVLLEAAQTLVAGVFLGLLYFQVSDDLYQGTYDRLAALGTTCIIIVSSDSHVAVNKLQATLPLLRREQRVQAYPLPALFLARFLVELPLIAAANIPAAAIIYFTVGLQPVASNFVLFAFTFMLLRLTTEALGLLVRAASKDAASAWSITNVVNLFLIVATGFLTFSLPSYLAWLQYVLYSAYVYRAVFLIEFSGLTLHLSAPAALGNATSQGGASLSVTMLSTQFPELQHAVLGDRGQRPEVGVAACCAVIAAQGMLFICLTCACLRHKARRRTL